MTKRRTETDGKKREKWDSYMTEVHKMVYLANSRQYGCAYCHSNNQIQISGVYLKNLIGDRNTVTGHFPPLASGAQHPTETYINLS